MEEDDDDDDDDIMLKKKKKKNSNKYKQLKIYTGVQSRFHELCHEFLMVLVYFTFCKGSASK
jgi:hypothetical protein